jgi:hypothetical protein
MTNAAKDAGGAIGTPAHSEKLTLFSKSLENARKTQNQFVVEAVMYLHDKRTG